MSSYEVAIAGGGFAGLSTAWKSAEKGLRTIVIERSKEIGYPIKTSGGTFVKTMKKINASKDLYNVIHMVVFHGPSRRLEFEIKNDIFCIIDVRGTLQHLAKKALENGADVLIDTNVKEPILEKGYVHGIILDNDVKIYSELTIDATGVHRTLIKHLHDTKAYEAIGIGLEFLIHSKDMDGETAHIYVGSKYAPSGYGWIFPLDDGYARVGIGVVKDPDQRINLGLVLDKFLEKLNLNRYKVLEKHSGYVPVAKPTKNFTHNGLLAIGDASCQLNMATGEGIRYAIDAGFLTADVAEKAIENKNFSKKFLKSYFTKKWPYSKSIYLTYLINKRIVNFTDKEWDKTIENLRNFTIDELEKLFLGEFSKLDLLKIGFKSISGLFR